ncbi:MAG: type II toxin-antitoxin system RelE/ParE family toxin [Terracidiphilus sp.]
MAIKLLWRPQAEEDLVEIYCFIALDRPAAADRILARLQTAVETLACNPRICQRRPDIRPTTRVLVEGPYLVLYEIHPDTEDDPVREVEIVRVVDGRRNLKTLL